MTFCQKCGCPVENGSGFCAECGTAVSTVQTPSQPPFRQPVPPPYYPPQPIPPTFASKPKHGSVAKTLALIAMIALGAALLFDIAGIFDMYKNLSQDVLSRMLSSSFSALVLPFALSLFVPLVTWILVQTNSTKAAKPFRIVVICALALQLLATAYSFIHYNNLVNGVENIETTYWASMANSVRGSGILSGLYNFAIAITKANRIHTYLLMLIISDALYLLKNIMAILSLRKLSRS